MTSENVLENEIASRVERSLTESAPKDQSNRYFIRGMMPEQAIPVQANTTIIEIRPYRGGWQCYEGPSVGPYWVSDTAKEDAIGYAKARAKFGRGEIRVLNNAGEVRTKSGY